MGNVEISTIRTLDLGHINITFTGISTHKARFFYLRTMHGYVLYLYPSLYVDPLFLYGAFGDKFSIFSLPERPNLAILNC
jgi:hypothetical protein